MSDAEILAAFFSLSYTIFLLPCSLKYERVSESANFLLRRTEHRPKIAIICGSGLGKEKRRRRKTF